jgi:spermidine synthase
MTNSTKIKIPHINQANKSYINWVMFLYFCSGACSLIDEVVWVRLLKLTLGNTVYASSIVVSVFMGGLALGALIMARFADRVRNRLRLYAFLEICATISALLLPLALKFADGIYRWFFVKYHPLSSSLYLVQIIVSTVILLVPTLAMGSTFPLLGRYVTSLQYRIGSLVGRLYALNTLGAALGCFLAGFVLIRLAGVMGTLYIAAAINMMVAVGGFVLSRRDKYVTELQTEFAKTSPQLQVAQTIQPAKYYWLMLTVFGSGLISIGYELIWMRSIVFLLGGFTYIFSAVLTIYLVGNVIGAWIGSILSKYLKLPAAGYGFSLICLGTFGIAYVPWLTLWSMKKASLFTSLFGTVSNNSFVIFTIMILLSSIFLFIIPAIIMGIGFPLALQAWNNYRHHVGQSTGTMYGANTIGAVLGGILTGFLLIPLIGVQYSITFLGLTGIWLGTIIIVMFTNRNRFAGRIVWLIIAAGLTSTVFTIPSDLFIKKLVNIRNTRLIAAKEGVTTTVSVHEGIEGDLTIATSGIPVAGDSLRSVQKILGHLGLLLNPNATEVLSVGFGSGETTACMALHKPNRIDAVEISPELVDMAIEFFPHLNLGDQLDKNVNMIYMDAKNYLHLTEKKYDLIINDCIDPRVVADNASLYTKEYFSSALDHLKPKGVFATYLPFAAIPISCNDSILGTFMEVFPYITVWFPTTTPAGHSFLYLAGSREPQLFSPTYIEQQLQKKGIRDSVRYINFNNSLYVLSCYIADQNDLKNYLTGFHLNSDFRPYVEFNTDINKGKETWFFEFIKKVRHYNGIVEHIDWAGLSADEKEKYVQDCELFYNASTFLLKAGIYQNVQDRLSYCNMGLELMPEHPAFIEVEDKALFHLKGQFLAGNIDTNALMRMANEILQQQSQSGPAWLIKSWILQRQKNMNMALTAAEKAAQYSPRNASVQDNLGDVYMELNQADKAIEHYNYTIQLNPGDAQMHFKLALVFLRKGLLNQSISQFNQGLQIQPLNSTAHCHLADVLAQKGLTDDAINHYRQALRTNPNYGRARDRLNELLNK